MSSALTPTDWHSAIRPTPVSFYLSASINLSLILSHRRRGELRLQDAHSRGFHHSLPRPSLRCCSRLLKPRPQSRRPNHHSSQMGSWNQADHLVPVRRCHTCRPGYLPSYWHVLQRGFDCRYCREYSGARSARVMLIHDTTGQQRLHR